MNYTFLEMLQRLQNMMGSTKPEGLPTYVYDKPFTLRFPDRCELKNGLWTNSKGQMTLEQIKALELRCMAMVQVLKKIKINK
jgi:hypothetical protein